MEEIKALRKDQHQIQAHRNLSTSDTAKLHYLLGQSFLMWECHDPDYLSYITPKIIINRVIELAKEHFLGLSDKVIWDMFAGIGCDGLRLARHSGKVICTEINPDTYKDLVRNVETMDVCNVEVLHADCSTLNNVICNIVYFDPPWGDTFRSGEMFDFADVCLVDGTSVLHLAQKISLDYHMIIKSPISSDSFETLFGDRVTEIFTFTQQKLKFLIVKAINEIEY